MINKLTSAIVISSLIYSLPSGAQSLSELPLMPWPQQVEVKNADGKWVLNNTLDIYVEGDDLGDATRRWRERIETQTGWQLTPHQANNTQAPIKIFIEKKVPELPSLQMDESYQITTDNHGATIKAATRFGAMRAMETLLQLIQTDGENTFIPLLTIKDSPRFAWRGVMLDSSRHFLPINDILRQIDGMAAAKLNVFHWHLTDDQGWRFESLSYPKLQQLASDGQYYTQDQMRQVVAYAKERGIRVVPEIDFPGHASAIAVAYPELMSAPGPYQMERHWGVHQPLLNPTQENVYQFTDSLINELTTIFPDEYIHIGGDEVDPTQWKNNPAIQEFMQKNNLKDTHALQAYFNQRLEQILTKHNRKMVGWDEIQHPSLSKNIVIQSWQGQDSLGDSAQEGFKGLLSTGFYLDQSQSAAYHYRNEILPQPLTVETNVKQGEQSQSWQFEIERLKGSPVKGSFTLIKGSNGWRGFIDFAGKSRREINKIEWFSPKQVSFSVDTWMGETRPVVTLTDDKLSGYTIIGNARYPTTGTHLTAIPEGIAPTTPDNNKMTNILGGEIALWAENIRAPIIDTKLWPRAFAVSERLWSAKDVNNENDMYRRLNATDAWSTISVGLQQHAQTAREFTRLANGVEIEPLMILSESVEPAHYYTRHHLKWRENQYHQYEPLNRFVDALPAESMQARAFRQHIDALIAKPNDTAAAQWLEQRLKRWQDNIPQVQRLIKQNANLVRLTPVTENVEQLTVIGLELIKHYTTGEPLAESRKAAILQQLEKSSGLQDEVVIAIVEPLEKLLRHIPTTGQ
ncbi:beta-N-acetylhexosaminidase [Providencia stuartii]|uniref:beta-N-acetylhexosaminidase n=1 Tax=Providencia TaxID=586 RepID=UPI00149525B9|nr:family 20 glycosylhydrolase [Providencia stuartii]NPD39997.1 family 20 glycosylhydrolase [Providencia stuartii]NPD93935.1 family 20 glycosylhydrolase [Providencia stuartii]HEM6914906.1 family 20 glycosylhydrolase [Providencia stuartii]HEM7166805.1 family 20 glycosylhydrolase [Providencia stuartii]